jgi:hypothetical protein
VPVPAVRKRPLAPFFIAPPAHPALGGSNWVLFCRVCTLVHLGSRWSMARWGPLQLPSSPLRFWVTKVTTAAFLSNRMVLTERRAEGLRLTVKCTAKTSNHGCSIPRHGHGCSIPRHGVCRKPAGYGTALVGRWHQMCRLRFAW